MCFYDVFRCEISFDSLFNSSCSEHEDDHGWHGVGGGSGGSLDNGLTIGGESWTSRGGGGGDGVTGGVGSEVAVVVHS